MPSSCGIWELANHLAIVDNVLVNFKDGSKNPCPIYNNWFISNGIYDNQIMQNGGV